MTNGAASLGDAVGRVLLDSSGVDKGMQSAQQAARLGFDAIGGTIKEIGDKVTGLGTDITTLSAPLTLLGTASFKTFASFDEAMTNIQTVTGKTAEETALLSEAILKMGSSSRFGPQAVAEAMYDVVGGVADASKHMDILAASVKMAEAGNAQLAGTTKALISVMNSYQGSGLTAAKASDVLTQTVAKGVGTMDEFAAALPNVTGVANTLGISFDKLGGMMAYLTTKGNTASEAATQLSSMMVALIRPNTDMADALKKIGYESGEAAIKNLGLVGTYKALVASGADIAGITGRVEGLRGVIALTGEGSQQFLNSFNTGLDGLTERSQKIQNASPAAVMARLHSEISALTITFGRALVPVLEQVSAILGEVIPRLMDFIEKHSGLIGKIGMVVGALSIVGPILMGLGKAISAVGGLSKVFGVQLGSSIGAPLLAIVALIGGLYVAWQTNFLGLRDAAQPVIDTLEYIVGWLGKAFDYNTKEGGLFGGIIGSLRALFYVFENGRTTFFSKLFESFGMGKEQAEEWGLAIVRFARDFGQNLERVASFVTDRVLPALLQLANWFIQDYLPKMAVMLQNHFLPFILDVLGTLAQTWDIVSPGLGQLFDWFVVSGLPGIESFLSNQMLPAVGSFLDALKAIWDFAAPYLLLFLDWMVNTGLPVAIRFIRTDVIPTVGDLIQGLKDIWDKVQPYLSQFFLWVMTTGLPAIATGLSWFTEEVVWPAIEMLQDVWRKVQPYLQQAYDWFVSTGLPAINNAINWLTGQVLSPAIKMLRDVWDQTKDKFQALYDWVVTTGLPAINEAWNNFKDNILQPVINKIKGIWDEVGPFLGDMKNGMIGIFNDIKSAMDPFITTVQKLIDGYNSLKNAVGGGGQMGYLIEKPVYGPPTQSGQSYGARTWTKEGGYSNFGYYQEGGHTGEGSPADIAGLVHRREWVIPEKGSPVVFAGGLLEMVQSMRGLLQGWASPAGFAAALAPALAGGPSLQIGNIQVNVTPETIQQYPAAQQYAREVGQELGKELSEKLHSLGGGVIRRRW